MIPKFEKFNDLSAELDQLEDIFTELDLEMDTKRISSDIRYEGLSIKNIPKLSILIEFDTTWSVSKKNTISFVFGEVEKKIKKSESFGYELSHALVDFLEHVYNIDTDEPCYGFDNPQYWIDNELSKYEISSIRDFDVNCTIKWIKIFFNPIK